MTGPADGPVAGAAVRSDRELARAGPDPDLGSAAVTVRDDAVADTVRSTLGEHPDAGGVVLVDARHRPTGYLNRSRFLLAMAGPFGHALWANKPARDMADAPRTADERTSVREAMEIGLAGDPARGYDDLVLVGPDGTCTGIVPMSELWRSALRRDPRPTRPVPGRVIPSPGPAVAAARPDRLRRFGARIVGGCCFTAARVVLRRRRHLRRGGRHPLAQGEVGRAGRAAAGRRTGRGRAVVAWLAGEPLQGRIGTGWRTLSSLRRRAGGRAVADRRGRGRAVRRAGRHRRERVGRPARASCSTASSARPPPTSSASCAGCSPASCARARWRA